MGTSLRMVLFFLLCFAWHNGEISAVRKSYIVYLGEHSHGNPEASPAQDERVRDYHREFLGSLIGSKDKARDFIFYSYTRHINGFAAHLGEEEAAEISKHPDVISVFPSQKRNLHTTRAWEFLGLEKDGKVAGGSIWEKSKLGEGIIIGNLDTGVWPDSESFNDDGMGPVPSKWKGECQRGKNGEIVIRCNRKLIGAKYFNAAYKSEVGCLGDGDYSAIDYDGHGTHTLSIAGGAFVGNASVFGYGAGTAKGGAPNARVAAYKVCWPYFGCDDVDFLAAIDAAIDDGVDVISVSLGAPPIEHHSDAASIGSFHATKRGIVVLSSAGNSGPNPETLENIAPWMITVAASTIDREFNSYAELGNGMVLKGQSLSSRPLPPMHYPLISSDSAQASNSTKFEAASCMIGSLDPAKVKGKIVACEGRFGSECLVESEAVRIAGGHGAVIFNDEEIGDWTTADAHIIPATRVSYADGLRLFPYINSSSAPTAYITRPTTQIGIEPAPIMAYFSSRGPNTINPEFLKPDITAPGVSIIAAYTQARGPEADYIIPDDPRRVSFHALSGTSMSTPMVAGVAGLLKALHPDWTPAAIKSAIMTTASVTDNRREQILNAFSSDATPLDYGSGHINPNLAMDPGLVYDATMRDYMNLLCSFGYSSTQRNSFANESYSCPSTLPRIVDFNYPSITIPRLAANATVIRRVKNVGPPISMYTVRIRSPPGVLVTVLPKALKFKGIGEEKTFTVAFKSLRAETLPGFYVFGSMTWSDDRGHKVRSPLAVGLV